ncbi:hypothetical protein GTH32_17870 [Alteromonas sp. 345S023]|uniref:Uncharacterized protein n=1 Tax=Alteromonas profundi TaxID=2696062 RepID=A0A7X5LPA7_9ALTE|nr:hypothetical protein [Alteromonas profundi]NDV93039.1 hypothetical protein [Alteromonas profundi]
MDLALANLVTILFFISGYKIIQSVFLSQKHSLPLIVFYSLVVFSALAISSVVFALLLGYLLPDTYPKTFAYKALLICPIISIYFSYKMVIKKPQSLYQ